MGHADGGQGGKGEPARPEAIWTGLGGAPSSSWADGRNRPAFVTDNQEHRWGLVHTDHWHHPGLVPTRGDAGEVIDYVVVHELTPSAGANARSALQALVKPPGMDHARGCLDGLQPRPAGSRGGGR